MSPHFLCLLLQSSILICASQPLDVNDQDASSTLNTYFPSVHESSSDSTMPEQTTTPTAATITIDAIQTTVKNAQRQALAREQKPLCIVKLYNTVSNAVKLFIWSGQLMILLRKVGACVVNALMDIVSRFVPSPLMPLVASAAGSLFPLEPVLMLQQRLPLSGYRRALAAATDAFLRTFEKYKLNVIDDYYDRYKAIQ